MNPEINARKIAIVGCGMVGATSAFALMEQGLFSELVLVDVNRERAEGEAMDIGHGMTFASPMNIYAGDYDDIMDASIIVITAGASQKVGETRLDLVKKNAAIFGSIIPEIAKRNYQGILLIVANPVDILTHVAQKLSGFPRSRVFGSGTVLDTGRLKYLLGQHLDVDPRNIDAYIIGEHGDSEIPVWSSAYVSGMPLSRFCEFRGHHDHEAAMEHLAQSVKDSAYEIIKKKKATYYGIAMGVRRICSAIIRDEKSVLPVSVYLDGEFGLSGATLSVPAIVGAQGIEKVVPISLSKEEGDALQKSAEILKETAATIGY
ncbi:L-lactate dehydrogenase [Acidaminococcus sp.]|jgi:L-lactate dehydrogenase|uniref:L-lactate dehydrogenase n=1 Tax=Acidaminococcus intestini TaxID=187327 RepID=A0A943EGU2_9FIRM|nr:L-lactate dehydrogenase [Acidaminococcus sp.]MBS5519924.1 L-lactate dehydrogenase [Acidaminococcus intestini]MDY2739675.1 L-lactate dehydrogenase [Acidaminococcus sp.]